MRYEGGEMKVLVGKTVFGIAHTVRLQFEGKRFPTNFHGTQEEAEAYAARIRKSLNRSGTKKKSLTTVAGL
jgi:hypothetical protein